MGAIIAVAVILAVFFVWIFFKFQPDHHAEDSIAVFNRIVLVFAAVIFSLWYFNINGWLAGMGLAEKYRGLLGVGGGCGILALWFLFMFLIRNFWLFTAKNFDPSKLRARK